MPKITGTDLEAKSCQACGATRPAQEILSPQGCANCANLGMMAHAIENEKKAREEAEAASKKMTEDLKQLPQLDKPASSLYDNESGVWWFGVNLKDPNTNAIGIMLMMDQAKIQAIQSLADWQIRAKKRSSLIIGMPSSVKDALKGASDKVVEMKERAKKLFLAKA